MRLLRIVLRLLRLVVVVAVTTAVLAATVVMVAPRAGELVGAHVSDHSRISLDPLSERSYVYDRYGRSMATLVSEQNRVKVKLSDISDAMIQSVIAVEDEHFYEHKGVNVRSIARALSANLDSGGVEQGGSTITQQLIKNSGLGNEKDLSRKMREAFLAVELEKEMTKQQILERYLNTVYFGNGAYGVEAASELYFTIKASDINYAQAALLTALIRGPAQYDPFKHKQLALERRAVVFDVLVRQKLIPKEAVELLASVPLPLFPNKPPPLDDYFVEEVKQQLLDDPRLGPSPTARYNAVFGGGLRIYTTFDPFLQFQALQARNETLPDSRGDGTFNLPPDPTTGAPRFGSSAMVGIEPSSGAVRMMVGGPGPLKSNEYDFASVNLATQGVGRQPGSSFKTFVLTEAMEQGYSPSDTISGSGPCKIPGYPPGKLPGNFGNSRGGTASLESQTLKSSNCAYLRLGQVVGLGKVADLAQRMGITTPLSDSIPSMPIGSLEVHPIDMAAAYSVLANDGVRNPAYYIDRVTDAQGRIIFEHQSAATRVVSPESARLVNSVLTKNVESGTATRARLDNGQPAAGKTGTTNGASDVWFVGYTPQLSVSIWMGGTSGRVPLTFGGGATGGRYPAATWGALMNRWLVDQPIVDFPEPEPRPPSKKCLRMPSEGACRSRPSRPNRSTGRPSRPSGGGSNTNPSGGPTSGPAPANAAPPTTARNRPTQPDPVVPN